MNEEQLKAALIQADQKGDKEAAQLFANKIKQLRSGNKPATAEPQPEQMGFLGRVSDAFTGADRATQETAQLRGIGAAPELNELSFQAAKTGLVQTFGSDEDMIKRLQETGAKISQDEKGNYIAELPSGRYLVNPPGVDPADIAGGIGKIGAFLLGSRLAPQTVAGQAAAGGVTSATMQGAVQAAGGEDLSITEAATDAALGGAGQAAANLIGAGARLLSRGSPADDAAAQAVRFAEQNKLPISTTDVIPPTSFAGRSAQSLGEKVPLVGTAGIRESTQAARQDIVKKLSAKYGEPSMAEISSSLARNASKVKQAAGKRIESTINAARGVDIPLNNTVAAIDDLIGNMTQPGRAFDQSVVNRLNEFKQSITSAPNDIEAIRQNRTFFREFIKGDSPVMSNQADRANKIIYDAMTKDMQQGVKTALGPEAASKLAQADAVYAQEVAAIKNTRLKNVLAKGNETPEVVANMIFSKKPSEVGQIYRGLDATGKRNARAAVVHKAFEQFAKNESPDAFLNQMSKMQPQINIMFKGQEGEQLRGLINYLQHTKQAGRAGLVTPTGQQLFQIGAVGDIVYTGGAGTAGAATVGALARAYESKPVMRLLMRLNRETPGSRRFEELSGQLTKLMTAEMQSED